MGGLGDEVDTGNSNSQQQMNGGRKHQRDWLQKLLRKHEDPELVARYRQTNDILEGKALVVAPMVDQSDLPFRMLCRRHGANLCFTPMIHARMFVRNERGYKTKFWNVLEGTPKEDRPLVIQFAGGDPDILLEAAKLVEHQVDAIDLNCGCPQMIAKRGNYGAYLLEDGDQLVECVRRLAQNISIPITVKVRLLPSGIDESLKLYTRLVDAGASMLTIHGRTRLNKGVLTGASNWKAIRLVVDTLGHRIPIIANGSIQSTDDIRDCLRVTGADGVMSSEAILEYPPIFSIDSSSHETINDETVEIRTGPSRLQLAKEYMELAKQYPPNEAGQGSGNKCVKMHLHRFLHVELKLSTELRDEACFAQTEEDLESFLEHVEIFQMARQHQVKFERLAWYWRHRMVDDNGVNLYELKVKKEQNVVPNSDSDCVEDECLPSLFVNDEGGY